MDKAKGSLNQVPWASLIALALTLVLVWVVWKQVVLSAQDHKFTAVETTSYSVAQVLVSVALSWMFSKVSFDAAHRQYANAAVRRLVSFKQSVTHLRTVISERRQRVEADNGDVSVNLISEFFTHCDSLVQELERDATNSIQDWGGVAGATISGMAFLSELETAKIEAEDRARQLELEMQTKTQQIVGENEQDRQKLVSRYEADINKWRQRAKDAEAAKDSLGRLGQVVLSGSSAIPGVNSHLLMIGDPIVRMNMLNTSSLLSVQPRTVSFSDGLNVVRTKPIQK